MERSGEMDIREDEQGRKTGVETFACGTCGQQVTVGPGIVLRRLSELSKRAVIRHVQGWSTS